MTETQSTIMYLEGVTVSFDGFKALQDVDFYVDRGEIRALIGPNGAGKTTLLDAICGKVKPDSGRIIFGDHTELHKREEHEITMMGIGRKFQAPSVFRNLTLFDNLTLALRYKRSVFATLFGVPGPAQRDTIHQTLETHKRQDKL
jgi:urea transport system ATP-binding protein